MAEQESQTTLAGTATVSGIALHTGHRVNLTIGPAPADSGVVFRRLDLPGRPEVPAAVEHVAEVQRGTTLRRGSATVHTVEHVLAALHALGVDNALVEMTAPEPPIGDGSATVFVDLVQAAGVQPLEAPCRVLRVTAPLYYESGETRTVVVPDDGFRVSCTVKFGDMPLACQYRSFAITPEVFTSELAAARTFCLAHEIEALMTANLICGGSLDNAIVVQPDAVLSKDGLRYPDEFVRHKILDIVGDMFLTGARLRAHIITVKPGHAANVAVARRIREATGV